MTNKCNQLAIECSQCFLHKEGTCKGIFFNDEMNIKKFTVFCAKKKKEMDKRAKAKNKK